MTYYMLHKPQGYVSACRDREHPTVMDLFPEPERSRLFPLGRLDKNTRGLLLVTDDGKLNRRLLDPEGRVEKCYDLWATGQADPALCQALRQGLVLKGLPQPTRPARFQVLETGRLQDLAPVMFPNRLGLLEENPEAPVFHALLWLTEGKRHQVKRMLEAVGSTVVALQRIGFGPLRLDPALLPGQYRPLRPQELQALLRCCPEKKRA